MLGGIEKIVEFSDAKKDSFQNRMKGELGNIRAYLTVVDHIISTMTFDKLPTSPTFLHNPLTIIRTHTEYTLPLYQEIGCHFVEDI
mmetsp:Transcript_8537/g.17719  ORF Transcript_8537/g.17719 Transcript_8537/m.17719 type:complete len:86 (-) Transcript_8537:101-358(-)